MKEGKDPDGVTVLARGQHPAGSFYDPATMDLDESCSSSPIEFRDSLSPSIEEMNCTTTPKSTSDNDPINTGVQFAQGPISNGNNHSSIFPTANKDDACLHATANQLDFLNRLKPMSSPMAVHPELIKREEQLNHHLSANGNPNTDVGISHLILLTLE